MLLPPSFLSGMMAHLLNEIHTIPHLPTDMKRQVRCGRFCCFLNMSSCWDGCPWGKRGLSCTGASKGGVSVQKEEDKAVVVDLGFVGIVC